MSAGLGEAVRGRRGRLILAAAASAFASTLGLVPAYVVYRLAAAMMAGGENLGGELPALVALAAGSVIAKAALQAFATHIAHVAAYDILRDVRVAIADHLARLPLGALGGRTIGSTRKILHDDVEQIEGALSHAIPDIAAALAAPLAAIALMTAIDPWLGLALFLPIPVILALYWTTLQVSEEHRAAYFGAFGRLSGLVVQYVRGMKVIKAFTRADVSYAELTRAIDGLADATEAYAAASLKPFVAMLTLLRGVVIVVLPLGAALVAFGISEPASLALALLLAIGVAPALAKLTYSAGQAYWRMKMANVEIGRLFALPTLAEPAAAKLPDGHALVFDGVTLRIDGRTILDGVSFEAPAGSVTALVGPSGAGKTTIARLAARLMDPTAGAIRLGGSDLRDIGTDGLMANVAFVFQDTFLFDDTIRANIRIGRAGATDAEVEAAARRAGVMEFVDELEGGLDAAIGEDGGRLSGGQRQRIAIARALVKDAPVVILDEATASLDPDSERQVHEALAALSAGRTVLIVAHRLETIRSADQIVVVRDGRVEAAGKHERLLAASPTYRDQWRAYEASETWRFDVLRQPAAPSIPRRADAADPAGAASDAAYAGLSGASFGTLFLRLLGPERRRFFKRALPLQLAESLFHGAPILVVAASLNDLMTGSLTPMRAGVYALILAACFAAQIGLHLAALRTFWRIQPRAVAALQKSVALHLRRLPLSYFLSADAGRLNGLISTHPAQLDFITSPGQFLRAVVAPPIAAVILAFIDWRLTLLLIATLPLYLVALARTDRIFRGVFAELVEVRADADRAMLEFLRGLPVIRAFGLTARSAARFGTAMTAYRDASLATVARVTPVYGLAVAIVELGFVAVVAVGAALVVSGSADIGAFLLFAVLSLAFYAPLLDAVELSSHRRLVERSMAKVGEAFETSALPEPDHATATGPDGFDIAFDTVGFSYDRRPTLSDVSFAAPAGRMTALVGPSGAGKTTIAHLVARFWDVGHGAVRIGGADVRSIPSGLLYDSLAMVFQDDVLFDDTVAANLRLGRPEASDDELERAARAARIHDRIAALPDGYATRLGEGAYLSGGERQRLAIARALLKDAPIILLDEATASIDPENEILIREALAELTQGRTVLVIAHRLASVAAADQIVVLTRDGCVAGAGRHDDLLVTCELYRSLWRAQQGNERWRNSA